MLCFINQKLFKLHSSFAGLTSESSGHNNRHNCRGTYTRSSMDTPIKSAYDEITNSMRQPFMQCLVCRLPGDAGEAVKWMLSRELQKLDGFFVH